MTGRDSASGLSAAQRQLLEQRLKGARRVGTGPAAIVRRTDPTRAPLSFAQQGLWFLDRLDPSSGLYNIPMSVKLTGPLLVTALQASLNDVVARHEILRTTFRQEHDAVLQIIAAAQEIVMQVTDLRMMPPALREEAVREIEREAGVQPFDLASGPLIRAHLLRMGEQEHLLQLTVHHIIFDAWSTSILLGELASCYERRLGRDAPALADLPVQFGDFAAWQHQWLASDAGARELKYWRDTLQGVPQLLDLPADRARPAVRSGQGRVVQLSLGPEATRAVRELSRNEGATLFATVLAAFDVLLLRYSGQEDLVIGAPVTSRNRRELEPLLGYFVNMLVLRTVVAGDPTFREFLARVRSVVNSALDHPNVPFDKLVEMLQPVRVPSYNPIFQVGYQYQVGTATEHRATDLEFIVLANEAGAAKFDLTLSVAELADDIMLGFEYSTDLFEHGRIEQMLAHLRTLLCSAAADPDCTIRRLPMLDEAERSKLLFGWNATATDTPLHIGLPQLFEAQVERSPQAVAVVSDSETLTYRALNERANQLAHYLREQGVVAESRVAICVERSTDMIVGVLGILKAGAAYVPLDPAYPQERLGFMLEDSAAPVLLTQSRLLETLPAYAGAVVCLDGLGAEISALPIANGKPVAADQLAYVIYTSGSTGCPKGVLLRHGGLTNLVLAQSRAFGVGPGRKVLQFASFSFDAAISEIGMALATGAALHVVAQEVISRVDLLTACLREQAIDVITLPPSLLAVLDPLQLPQLRTVISAGEACIWDTAQRWSEGRDFFNAYGPTEATVGPTFYKVEEPVAAARTVPIGRPIDNMQIYVLDGYRQPVPAGVPGEVFIGGVGVARGYLNRPELTAERFVANPFVADTQCRLYRSGDQARFLLDGNLEFLGRIDQQVKIRGFRIEIGELEAIIAAHPQVREAAVVVIGSDADRRLVACIVGDSGLAEAALRDHLRRHLPAHMQPSVVLFVEQLPLTPNAKVDRKALTAQASQLTFAPRDVVEPRNASEQFVAKLFGEVLGRGQIGVLDSFFDLGGNSLMAARLMTQLRTLSGHDIPLRSLFDHPTVAGLASVIDAFNWSAPAAAADAAASAEREELEF